MTERKTTFEPFGEVAQRVLISIEGKLGSIITERLDRIEEQKRWAMQESNRTALLRIEGEENALQEILDEAIARTLNERRGGEV